MNVKDAAIDKAAANAASKLTPALADLLLKSNALQKFIRDFNPYCSLTDLSKFFKIPYSTLQTWVASGKLPCLKVPHQDPKLYLKDLQIFAEEYDNGDILHCCVCGKRLICDTACTPPKWVCPDGCAGATESEPEEEAE